MDWFKEVIIALIVTTPPTIMALIAWRSGRTGRTKIGDQIAGVATTINGQRDKLIEEVGALKTEALGLKEEIRELKEEVRELKRVATRRRAGDV